MMVASIQWLLLYNSQLQESFYALQFLREVFLLVVQVFVYRILRLLGALFLCIFIF
jgi:hypothetical protein